MRDESSDHECSPASVHAVIETIRGSDYVILVSEPTPFGLHDLTLAVETVRALDLARGVVINRTGYADWEMRSYCERNRIPILQEFPDDRTVAETYSRGVLAAEALAGYRNLMEILLRHVSEAMGAGVAWAVVPV